MDSRKWSGREDGHDASRRCLSPAFGGLGANFVSVPIPANFSIKKKPPTLVRAVFFGFSKMVGARRWARRFAPMPVARLRRPRCELCFSSNSRQFLDQKKTAHFSEGGLFWILENGRGEKIRTSDPHNPIVVRYQAALRPDRIRNKQGRQ